MIKKLVTKVINFFRKEKVVEEVVETVEVVEVLDAKPKARSAYFERVKRFAEELEYPGQIVENRKHVQPEPFIYEVAPTPPPDETPKVTWKQFKAYNQQVNSYLNKQTSLV